MPSADSLRHGCLEDYYPRTPRKSILGRGAFGLVFAVTGRSDPQQRYVAKEVQVAHMSPKKRRDALAESELLRAVSHPHIVTCVDALLLGDALYIVMEYADGGDLSGKIREQREAASRFPERTIMRTFAQVCSALQFAHRQKVLHRDIKPANLFIFGSGDLATCTVKLGDFGLGKIFDGVTWEAHTMVGSPLYLSPEVCKNKPYGRKADVWSLGVVLYDWHAWKYLLHQRQSRHWRY